MTDERAHPMPVSGVADEEVDAAEGAAIAYVWSAKGSDPIPTARTAMMRAALEAADRVRNAKSVSSPAPYHRAIEQQCAHYGGAIGSERCLITERNWPSYVNPERCKLCPGADARVRPAPPDAVTASWKARALAAEGAVARLASDAETIRREALEAFARKVIQRHAWGHDVECGESIQALAEELGLIEQVEFDPEEHNDPEGYGLEAGDPYFTFTGALAQPAPASSGPVETEWEPTHQHIKSGGLYQVVDVNVIDATNGHHDQRMVLYQNENGRRFVRERGEFHDGRFKELDEPEPIPSQPSDGDDLARLSRGQIRQAFEKHHSRGFDLTRAEYDDGYLHSGISAMWSGWEAAFRSGRLVRPVQVPSVEDFRAVIAPEMTIIETPAREDLADRITGAIRALMTEGRR